jgi:hypothetical protein
VNAALRDLVRCRAAAEYLALATGEPGASDRYLLDSSAIRRLDHRPTAERVAPLIAAGLVATCAIVDLELCAATPDTTSLAAIRDARAHALTWLPTQDADMCRAPTLQGELLAQGLNIPGRRRSSPPSPNGKRSRCYTTTTRSATSPR